MGVGGGWGSDKYKPCMCVWGGMISQEGGVVRRSKCVLDVWEQHAKNQTNSAPAAPKPNLLKKSQAPLNDVRWRTDSPKEVPKNHGEQYPLIGRDHTRKKKKNRQRNPKFTQNSLARSGTLTMLQKHLHMQGGEAGTGAKIHGTSKDIQGRALWLYH